MNKRQRKKRQQQREREDVPSLRGPDERCEHGTLDPDDPHDPCIPCAVAE